MFKRTTIFLHLSGKLQNSILVFIIFDDLVILKKLFKIFKNLLSKLIIYFELYINNY
jgi:hypothetical protein